MSRKNKTKTDLMPVWERITQAMGTDQQNEVAKKLGVTPQSVWQWTKGKLPRRDLLVKIAEIGNTTVDWLLSGDEGANPPVKPVPDHELAAMFYKWDELSDDDREELRTLIAMVDREIERRLKNK